MTGVAVGILMLRTLRRRREAPDEEEPTAEAVRTEAQAAVDHASAAVSHARVAGEKAVEYFETEVNEMSTTASEDDTEPEIGVPVRRLRKVGKGWIR